MAKDPQRIFTVELGVHALRIDEDLMNGLEVKKLKAAIRETRAEYDKELETAQKKLQELAKEISEKIVRLKDETDAAYEKRTKKVDEDAQKRAEEITAGLQKDQSYTMEIAYRCLKALATQFGQGEKVTRETFDLAPYTGLKIKLAKLFLSNEIEEAALFLPPADIQEMK